MANRYEKFLKILPLSVPQIGRGSVGPRNPYISTTCNTLAKLSQATADVWPPKLAGCTHHTCGSLGSYLSLSGDFFVAIRVGAVTKSFIRLKNPSTGFGPKSRIRFWQTDVKNAHGADSYSPPSKPTTKKDSFRETHECGAYSLLVLVAIRELWPDTAWLMCSRVVDLKLS